MKGCSSMKLDIRDINSRLSENVKIDFKYVQLVGIICMGKSKVKYKKLKS